MIGENDDAKELDVINHSGATNQEMLSGKLSAKLARNLEKTSPFVTSRWSISCQEIMIYRKQQTWNTETLPKHDPTQAELLIVLVPPFLEQDLHKHQEIQHYEYKFRPKP